MNTIKHHAARSAAVEQADDSLISKTIVDLRSAANDGMLIFFPPGEAGGIADALLRDANDINERLAIAGSEAARWQREAEQATTALVSEVAARTTMHRALVETVIDLEEELTKTLALSSENDRLKQRIARLEVVSAGLYDSWRRAQAAEHEISVEVVFTVGDAAEVGSIDPATASDLALELLDLNANVA